MHSIYIYILVCFVCVFRWCIHFDYGDYVVTENRAICVNVTLFNPSLYICTRLLYLMLRIYVWIWLWRKSVKMGAWICEYGYMWGDGGLSEMVVALTWSTYYVRLNRVVWHDSDRYGIVLCNASNCIMVQLQSNVNDLALPIDI